MITNKSNNIVKFAPILFGLCVLVLLTFYKINFGFSLMESDSASDIYYAHLLAEEGSVISNNYYFSTALRLFDNELLFALLFKLFPALGWWQIEIIGTVLMNGLMGLASVLLAYQLGLGRKSIWLFGLSLLPYSESELYYVLMHGCGYYGYAIFQVYLILAIYLGIVNYKKGSKALLYIEWGGYLGISLLAGMQGIRLLENLYIPLLLCGIGMFVYQFYIKVSDYGLNNIRACFMSHKNAWVALVGTFMALIGYGVNRLLLRNIFVWSNIENLKWKEFSFTIIETFIKEVLYNFGYFSGLELFSKRGIVNLASIILCIVVVCILARDCKKKVINKQNFIVYFFITAMLVYLFTYIFLMNQYRARYMLPFFMCLPHVVFVIAKEWKIINRKVIFLILGVCVILNSSNVMVTTFENGNGWEWEVSKQNEMTKFLTDNNYTYGFSTFQFGNSTIELSDGKLEICHLVSLQVFEKYEWLCSKDEIKNTWNEKTFLIVSDKQLQDYANMSWNSKEKIVWHDGGICVFSYESVNELQNAFIQ